MRTQSVRSSRSRPLLFLLLLVPISGCGESGWVKTVTGPQEDGVRSALRVSDLSVATAETNQVTLRFREVDDGSGKPASYDLRFARAPLGHGWGSANSVTRGTCKVPVSGTAIGAIRSCTVQGLEPGRRYDFQLVPFSGTMNEDATYGALSNIATAETADAPVRIEILPVGATLEVGEELRLRARVTDPDGNSLDRPVTWSSDKSSVASVDGSGSAATVRARNPGETGILARVEGVEAVSEIRVVLERRSGVQRPNEPAGFSRLAEHDFSCRPGAGCALAGDWSESPNAHHRENLSIVERSDAPVSGPRVVRTRFPRGLRAGTGPVSFGWNASGREYGAIYISKWIRIAGRDYENHPGLTKMGWIGFGSEGDTQGTLGLQTTPSSSRVQLVTELQPTFRQQGHTGGAVWGSGRVRVGEWHHWELLFEVNDRGRRNGVFKWWIDGRLVLSRNDMVFVTRGNERGFFSYRWNPTWGGAGNFTKRRDDYMEIDHVYISGVRK